jgi:superfamily II RNA helicase
MNDFLSALRIVMLLYFSKFCTSITLQKAKGLRLFHQHKQNYFLQHSGNYDDILDSYESMFTSLRGTPELVDKLEGLPTKFPGIELQMQLYRSLFPFPLDDFQERSLESLISGKNVIVMTPTGSGKTLVGELAIYFALMMGLKVIYTTPLKALSNQKYNDFRQKFGGDRVALLTGDIVINRGAPITIMTTEVFRNMVYDPDHDTQLGNTFMVCFDEFHYMNDPERGTVWEESVISCPQHLRILALSATMGNAQDIQGWLTTIHGPTDLIQSDYRPVPLRYFFALRQGLFPLFKDAYSGPGAVNGIQRIPHTNKNATGPPANNNTSNNNNHGKLHLGSTLNPAILRVEEQLINKQLQRTRQQSASRAGSNPAAAVPVKLLIPSYTEVADELRKLSKLPAIFFIFSRSGCEDAANLIVQSGLKLLNKNESMELRDKLTVFLKTNTMIPIGKRKIEMLKAGVGVHHAGLLPVWKAFIEDLFNANLIKILFATETLAAGKRSCVLISYSIV